MNIGIPKLGDTVEKALSLVGVTEQRISKLIGRPCNCKKRKERLNALSLWANRVLGLSASTTEEEEARKREAEAELAKLEADALAYEEERSKLRARRDGK